MSTGSAPAWGGALAAGLCLPIMIVGGACVDQPASEELVGPYSRTHSAWAFHGNEAIESAVEDRLLLRSTDSSTLGFTLQLVDLDGSGCTVDGEARPERSRFRSRATGDGKPCDVLFEPRSVGSIVVEPDPACLAALCPEFGSAAEGPFVRTD